MTYRSKWIQRDLEDQIAEEYKYQGKEYQFTNQKKETMAREIKISEVVSLLKQGYTRWTKEESEKGKSIQSHYNLSFSECKEVFNHPKIKGLRIKKPTISLVDDTETSVQASPVVEATIVGEVKAETPKKELTLEDKMNELFK